jgi:hypothetical protein
MKHSLKKEKFDNFQQLDLLLENLEKFEEHLYERRTKQNLQKIAVQHEKELDNLVDVSENKLDKIPLPLSNYLAISLQKLHTLITGVSKNEKNNIQTEKIKKTLLNDLDDLQIPQKNDSPDWRNEKFVKTISSFNKCKNKLKNRFQKCIKEWKTIHLLEKKDVIRIIDKNRIIAAYLSKFQKDVDDYVIDSLAKLPDVDCVFR